MQNFEFRSGAVNASDCIGGGWELVKPNYGLYIGMVVVEIVILFIISLIPYVGGLINPVVSGVLMCGIYIALLHQMRGENVDFGMMFAGFEHFLPAAVVAYIPIIPWVGFGFAIALFSGFFAVANPDPNNPLFLRGLGATMIIGGLVTMVVVIALQLLLFFALQLVADKQLGVIDAIKLSISASLANLGGLILLVLLEGLILIGGVLAFCIGIIFVVPIVYGANVVAYRNVFPDTQPSYFNQPPQPGMYGGGFGTPR